MRKDQVDAPSVKCDLFAEVLIAERRALDMPAGAAMPPGAVPARLVGLARPPLPQREVERILFAWVVDVGVILLAGDFEHALTRQPGQLSVPRKRVDSKKHAATTHDVGRVALQKQPDHLLHA